MAVERQLKAIDRQITQLWVLYRKWHSTGTSDISPVEALDTIDLLLEQRRDLTSSQGEMRNQLDVASLVEWGDADLGTAA